MKALDTYISEKLLINKNYRRQYSCKPTTWEELKYIIKERYKENPEVMDLNDVNVSEITDMGTIFFKLAIKELHIETWNVSNVENFFGMFYECSNLEKIDLSAWDVSNGTDFSNMFSGCIKFNSDLSHWDVSKGEYFNRMFYNCYNFNSDLSKWNISNGKTFDDMFVRCNPDKYPKGIKNNII